MGHHYIAYEAIKTLALAMLYRKPTLIRRFQMSIYMTGGLVLFALSLFALTLVSTPKLTEARLESERRTSIIVESIR